eukprot:6491819-Amphidinium_carterae.1
MIREGSSADVTHSLPEFHCSQVLVVQAVSVYKLLFQWFGFFSFGSSTAQTYCLQIATLVLRTTSLLQSVYSLCGVRHVCSSETVGVLSNYVFNCHEYLIYQGHTEDCVKLGKGPVRLAYANGSAYVSSHEWTQWCEDLFGQQVVARPDASIWVVWPDTEKSMSLASYQQAHSPITLGIHVWGSSTIMQYTGYVLDHPVHGARVFVALPDLYNNVIGSSGNMTASRWYQSWFPHWTKRLTTHSLPDTHIRRAAVTGHFGRKVTSAFTDGIRFYSQPSVS